MHLFFVICLISLVYSNHYSVPSLNSVILGFTMAYLVVPMKYTKQTNPFLIGMFIFFIFWMELHVLWLHFFWWSDIWNFIRIYFRKFLFSMLHSSGANNLLYFSESISNKTVCRPKNKNLSAQFTKTESLSKIFKNNLN